MEPQTKETHKKVYAKDIQEILDAKYPHQFHVRGSTPYEKKCVIYKFDTTADKHLEPFERDKHREAQFNSNREAYETIADPNWGPITKFGFFGEEVCGNVEPRGLWNIYRQLDCSMRELAKLILPKRIQAEYDEFMSKRVYNKYQPKSK